MQEQEPQAIEQFSGVYRFLSNFYPSSVYIAGFRFPTVEHAFQAMKSSRPEDWEMISQLATPGQAKRAGRKLPLRPDWETVKESIMLSLLRAKFIGSLGQALLMTGSVALIEGNDWGDRYWGVCRGEGLNRLGALLMQVRSEIQS